MHALIKTTRWLPAILLAALLGACAGSGVKTEGPAFSAGAIRNLIDGNTLQGPMGMEMYDWYYQSDGAVTGVVGASNDDSGTWLIKDSNTYCHRWDQYFDGVQHCYKIFKTTKPGQYLMENVDADRSENISVWKVIPGNPYKM